MCQKSGYHCLTDKDDPEDPPAQIADVWQRITRITANRIENIEKVLYTSS